MEIWQITLGIIIVVALLWHVYDCHIAKKEGFIYRSWDSVNSSIPVPGWIPSIIPRK